MRQWLCKGKRNKKETKKIMTLVPTYGRDYTSKAKVKADWNQNKDFEIASMGPDCGRKANKEDLKGCGDRIMIRYRDLTMQVQMFA